MRTPLKNSNDTILKAQNRWASFDGTTSYIEYADDDRFSFCDVVNDLPFEIEFDVMILSNNVGGRIVSKRGANTQCEWSIYFNTSNTLEIRLFGGGSSTIYISTRTTSALIINTLYRIKCTYNGDKTVTGLNIYVNNTLAAMTTASLGSYAGMTNDTSGVHTGASSTPGEFLKGYIRNLKITKQGQLIFRTPLQDANAVSKDVIGGLVHNAGVLPIVVNYLEREKWAYFNGVSSVASIGTISTLGWMNSGTFSMQYDITFPVVMANKYPIGTQTSAGASPGFVFYYLSNSWRMFFMAYGGGSVWYNLILINPIVQGVSYHISVSGDGAKYYYTVTRNDTGAVISTNEPVGTDCTYVPYATTNQALGFGYNAAGGYSTMMVKNFNIYSDFAGTVPFLSLPFQNAEDVITDRVAGLVGYATAVSIINNNENVLRSKNLWAYLNGTTANVYIGTTSTLGWMNDGIFRLEFDVNAPSIANNKRLLYTAASPSQRGFMFFCNGANVIFYWCNGSGTYGASVVLTGVVINTNYHIVASGNGTTVRVMVYTIDDGALFFDSGNVTVTIASFATTTLGLNAGAYAGAYTGEYIRNIKIYQSSDTSIPFMYLPLQDGGNIAKDVWGGLQGTANNVTVVEV